MTDDKVLLNPRWITEMELDPTSGEIDINLGMKRLYYLVKSIISIRDGGEVYRSGEPLVDAIIPAYLGQAQIMDEVREKQQKEKRNSLPKKEFD